MLPIKKILCPVDFSEHSYKALKAAEELALHFSAELYVMHVVSLVPAVAAPTGAMVFDIVGYQNELEASAKKHLHDAIKTRVSKQLKAKPILVTGVDADEIVRCAEEQDVDLVVISTHGRTGFRHLIFGSVAEKIVRYSNRPVLTIRVSKI